MSVWRDKGGGATQGSRGRVGQACGRLQGAREPCVADAETFSLPGGQRSGADVGREGCLPGGGAGQPVAAEHQGEAGMAAQQLVEPPRRDSSNLSGGTYGQPLDAPRCPGEAVLHPGGDLQHGPAAEGGPAVGGGCRDALLPAPAGHL